MKAFTVFFWLLISSSVAICQAQKKKDQFYNDFFNHAFNNTVEPVPLSVLTKKNGPKHVLEGLWNTCLVSGPLAIFGALSAISFPVAGLWSSTKDNEKSNIAGLVLGAVTGGVLGGLMWLSAAFYGMWQVTVGLIHTPGALRARIQGKTYYSPVSLKWEYYDLESHRQALSEATSNNAKDDSLYKLLGVKTIATSKDIKRAYYQLAKVYHPDKNPEHQETFLKIHQAYDTLYNPETRKAYDEIGLASTEGIDSSVFNTNVFFDVLFGMSSELENYIGDLTIQSVSAMIVQVAIAIQNIPADQQNKIYTDFATSFFDQRTNRQETRQIDIALYLQTFSADFVYHKNVTEIEYKDKCTKEARLVAESSPFASRFLKSIGAVLYWQSNASIQTPIDIPMHLASLGHSIYSRFKGWSELFKDFLALIEEYEEKLNQQVKLLTFAHPTLSKVEAKDQARNNLLQLMIPTWMKFVWTYNEWDITSNIKGAYWKLLHHRGTTWSQRCRQSRAMKLLGRTLLKEAKSMEELTSTHGVPREQERGEGAWLDFQTRVEVAFHLATNSAQTVSILLFTKK
jgi:curved DNA-binding protein CbpA